MSANGHKRPFAIKEKPRRKGGASPNASASVYIRRSSPRQLLSQSLVWFEFDKDRSVLAERSRGMAAALGGRPAAAVVIHGPRGTAVAGNCGGCAIDRREVADVQIAALNCD